MMATTSAPRLYLASSDGSGRFTLMTTSASFSASAETVAPTAMNSESGRPALIPAPGSTATSTPSALNLFTVSGEAATRGSDGSISLATAIFIGLLATIVRCLVETRSSTRRPRTKDVAEILAMKNLNIVLLANEYPLENAPLLEI